ncbi:protein pof1b-like protein, partial [Lasius niger]
MVPTMPCMGSQPSISGWTHPYDVLSDASNSHADLQKISQQFPEVFGVPTKPCMRVKPQPTTSGWQPPHGVSSHTSTLHTLLQRESQPFHLAYAAPMTVRDNIRQKIKIYLKIDAMMEKAAKEVVYETKNVEDVVRNYELESLQANLEFKTDFMRKKIYYWNSKERIEGAIKYIFRYFETNIKSVAEERGINETVLRDEFNKYESLKDKNLYEYE